MTKRDKLVQRMRNSPEVWQIADLQAVALHHGLTWRHDGGSHCVFITNRGKTLPVPAHKPIKQIYIKKFLHLLEEP